MLQNAMCIVLITRSHEHPDNYGSEGEAFGVFQWEKKGQAAVQSSPSFLSFGLGRWTCPGRLLTVHEIKIILTLLFSNFDVQIKEGSFGGDGSD